jgi:arsenate reductase
LEDQGVDFVERDIVKHPFDKVELETFLRAARIRPEELANPKGTRYRELQLKEKSLLDDQWLELLTPEGKLYRRPILWTDREVVLGFDPDQWARVLGL